MSTASHYDFIDVNPADDDMPQILEMEPDGVGNGLVYLAFGDTAFGWLTVEQAKVMVAVLTRWVTDGAADTNGRRVTIHRDGRVE